MSSFVEDMKRQGLKTGTRKTPVWTGPCGGGPNGGLTFSLLSRWLVCRERFRALTVEGLEPSPKFNHRLEFGNLWHACEEALARKTDWKFALEQYRKVLLGRFRFSQDEVNKWATVCELTFPEYVTYWKKHPDVKQRKPLAQEVAFDVPYRLLGSKRVVRLRGKWDAVDIIDREVWLQENKTKSDIDEGQIRRQLKYDLQTMMYLIALSWQKDNALEGPSHMEVFMGMKKVSLAGVRYNVIRRPLSGGKGNIKQKEATRGAKCPKCKGLGGLCLKCGGMGRVGAKPAETEQDYWARVAKYIKDEPETYFMRWKLPVSQADIDNFRKRTLDPILEHLCDWWNQVTGNKEKLPLNYRTPLHWVEPFNIYNVLLEGGSTDMDDYVLTGSTVGLTRTDNLFPELR